MKMTWYDLAKERMKALGVTQEDIAVHLGITKGAVSHWLNGRRQPTLQEISAIFNRLGIKDPVFNTDGTFSLQHGENPDTLPPEPQYSYPLFTSVQAGSFGAVGSYTEQDAKDWIGTTKKASDMAFWLVVEGHSMTAPTGSRPSFPEGMLILVDPAEDVVSGDYCVAGIDNDTAVTFKRFVIEDGKPWLEPLNPNPRYQSLECGTNCRIIGKVIKAQWPEDTF